ncbi:TetR/AcrR family transcriptional regulator [Uniformispora flossi]|uniref:TetR/AcrR family transcriptional regulator n=1 Tax=Uniformispora flossi TaxID=3390723 RepID=UPI003C2E019E
MPRWEPNAADRLADAALDLFAERGYEDTTVLDIARRAGLGKSTFFRHFQDKREVLFRADGITTPVVDAVATAPAGAGPFDALALGLDALGREVFTPERRPFAIRRGAVVDAHPELREREALKMLGFTTAIADAVAARGAPALTARVTAELGAIAVRMAYERWILPDTADDFGPLARRALADVRAAAAG